MLYKRFSRAAWIREETVRFLSQAAWISDRAARMTPGGVLRVLSQAAWISDRTARMTSDGAVRVLIQAGRVPKQVLALCGAAALILTGGVTYVFAAGVTTTSSGGWTTCTLDAHANVANDMTIRNNGSQGMCLSSPDYGDHFTVTKSSVNKTDANYPNIYLGCEFDGDGNQQLCSHGHASPPKLSSIGRDTSSVTYYYPQSGFAGDAAYDIWFNKSGGTPKGWNNGSEIMIWLGTNGIGGPQYSRKVEIDGIWWGYDSWNTSRSGGAGWHYIRYWRLSNETPHSSATLNLLPFFRDAENQGRLSSSWYLTGTEYGFEVDSGGKGLAVKNFSDDIEGTRTYLGGLQHKS